MAKNPIYDTVNLFATDIMIIDLVALVFFVVAWVGYSGYATRNYHRTPNIMRVMNDMRMRWMRQLVRRENRIADSGLLGNLLRSISFFANTSIFILMGLATMHGYRDTAIEQLNHLPFFIQSSVLMWDVKLFTLAVIFVYAFFKFTWSLRLYNYCCVLAGAAPMPKDNPEVNDDFAIKTGHLLTNASSHFNMGLRAYYFGLAAISWFLHPLLFMAVTSLVVHVVYRREFKSSTLNNLAGLSNGY